MEKYPELDFDSHLPPELHILLDAPPVTNGDDAALHELSFMGLAHVVKPHDFIEWLIVRDMAATAAETPLSSEEAADALGRPGTAVTCADGQLASASESAHTPTAAVSFPGEPRPPEES